MLLHFLVACGGGSESLSSDGNDNGSGGNNVTTITLSISDQLVTEQNSATVTATVLQGNSALASQVVTFTSTLGTLIPEAGTALTDSSGVASIVLNAGDTAGAGTVTATISSGEQASISFTTQGSSQMVLRLGGGQPFIEGAIDLSLSQISAGSTSTVSVSLVDDMDDFYNEAVEVNFTSVCAQASPPTAEIDTLISTSNGQASATYLAKGCVGDDVISVNTVVNNSNLSASGVINVLSANIGSIEFVSATPDTIGIVGTGAVGGAESSTVIFRVLDTNGNPVNNQAIDFSLSTETGGINLIPARASTNGQGLVQTVVNSGSVATSVRVIAHVIDSVPLISSQSSVLVISTGIPDQDSFSLSADILNPEAWLIDGAQVTVTARLADAFNNPVPDGTAVSFTAEGGSIEPSCTTLSGRCSVIWSSQLPRPEGHVLGDANNVTQAPEIINTMGQSYGGRVSIVATAIGEESFPDSNGNGRFDQQEMASFLGNDVSGKPYDLKEAFADYNEDGFFNPGENNAAEQTGGELEEFTDFNNDGTFTSQDGLYNGVLCALEQHTGCATNQQSINVRGQLVLVMSGSNARFITTVPENNQPLVIEGESTASASVVIADLHNQPMPFDSLIEFTSTVGSIVSGSPLRWGNDAHNGGQSYTVIVKGETEPKSGSLLVTVTTPSGVVSSHNVASITIN
jgi:hypothetical protein